MFRGVFRVAICVATLMLQGAAPAGAEPGAAESVAPHERILSSMRGHEADGRPAWLPYAEVALDLHQDEATGVINTLTEFEANDNYTNGTPYVKMLAGLLGPTIEFIPGNPRPFLDVGVSIVIETTATIADAGDIKSDIQQTSNFTGEGFGSEIVNRYQQPIVDVGVGSEFVLPWIDRRFRLRPSLEFEWQRIESTGRIRILDTSLPPSAGITNKASTTNDFYSFGMGLELEFVVTGGLSLFAETRVLWLLSDDEITWTDSANNEYVYTRKDLPSWHGGFGFRYAFIGL